MGARPLLHKNPPLVRNSEIQFRRWALTAIEYVIVARMNFDKPRKGPSSLGLLSTASEWYFPSERACRNFLMKPSPHRETVGPRPVVAAVYRWVQRKRS